MLFDREKLEEFKDLVLHAPLIAFAGNLVFVIEKPSAIRWNNEALHYDQGMAVEWKDGTGMYFLDGVKIADAELYNKIISHELAASEMFAIEDADVRAIALKYNGQAFFDDAELLDEHPTAGKLYVLKNNELNRFTKKTELYFLDMRCPSTDRRFVEHVEPSFAKKKPYALHCQAHNSGVPVEIYSMIRNHG